MKNRNVAKTAIGMMSGTSVDGIDACFVRICGDFSFEIIKTHSIAYPFEISEKILAAANNKADTELICKLNFVIGRLFARCANELIEKTGQKPDFIASHGQTVFHLPKTVEMSGINANSTLQIGDISVIAQETGVTTVGNFRTRDIAAGGQGAPLVPFADELIFKKETPRAIQNIGGIANVTILSPDCETFAFDIGPGNMLIDYFVKKFFNKPFDRDGEIALGGKIDEKWLIELLKEPYYAKTPPKTTGRELFNDDYAQKILRFAPENKKDLIATITALTAKNTADAYEKFVFPKTNIKEIVLGGGGAYNKAIVADLKKYLPGVEIKKHADFGINDKYKEALAFAMLGYCTLEGIENNLPACTGAKMPVVMGEIAF